MQLQVYDICRVVDDQTRVLGRRIMELFRSPRRRFLKWALHAADYQRTRLVYIIYKTSFPSFFFNTVNMGKRKAAKKPVAKKKAEPLCAYADMATYYC